MSSLRSILQHPDLKRVIFAGLGNVVKSDDGVGAFISKNILGGGRFIPLTVEMSLENYIGKINTLSPDIIVLLDCMDMNKKAGSYGVFGLDSVKGYTTNTHNISLSQLNDLFTCKAYILGVQPYSVDFGEKMCMPVRSTAGEIIKEINKFSILIED